jgi:hypothetical protein
MVEAGAGGGGLLLLMQPASKAAGASKANQRSMRNTFQFNGSSGDRVKVDRPNSRL